MPAAQGVSTRFSACLKRTHIPQAVFRCGYRGSRPSDLDMDVGVEVRLVTVMRRSSGRSNRKL